MRLSSRARNMPASPIRKLVKYADQAKAKGVRVFHLNIGQPDIPTPKEALAAYARFDEKVLAYGPSQGLPELRETVARYYRGLGVGVEPNEVSVTVGGSEGLAFAFDAVADPGEEIVVPEPFYANYAGFAVAGGLQLRPVHAHVDDGFRLPKDEAFEAALTPKTKAIVFSSPGNPTGTVYSKAELERLARFARKHDLFLISDEAYREFVYDPGVKATCALSIQGAEERTIVVDSISKRFSACGARVGFVISKNAELNDAFMRMCFARLCPPTVDQWAAIGAYAVSESYFHAVVEEYRKRRDVLVDGLNRIPGVHAYRPEGAFYAIVTLPVKDADHFSQWLLTDFADRGETVMLAPASGFYATPGLSKNEARIAYVLEVPALARSVEILERALAAYPDRS